MIVFVFEPREVLPLNVSIVNTIETDVPVVFWFASDNGGVHEMLVELDFVAIVADALPHL